MKPYRSDITKEIVDEMKEGGMSYNKIAKHFRVSAILIQKTASGDRVGRAKVDRKKSTKKCKCGNDVMPGNRLLCRLCYQGYKNNFDEDFLECA